MEMTDLTWICWENNENLAELVQAGQRAKLPIPSSAGATGRGARRTRLGDDGNLTCRAEIT
jgi:hypothetical protein